MKLMTENKRRRLELTTPNTPGSGVGVTLPFDLNNLRTRLGGIYKQQQTSFEVRQVRYFAQEDGYAYKIIDLMTNHLIGSQGIHVDYGNERLNSMWEEWKPSPHYMEQDATEMLRFMVLSLIRDGEILNETFHDSSNFFSEPIDNLDLPLDNRRVLEGPNILVQQATNSGITFDRYRRPIQYQFKPEIGGPQYQLDAKNVTHIYKQEYAGQTRGLSWFLGALDTMRELHEFESNISVAVKNAASDPGFYTLPKHYFPAMDLSDIDMTSPETVKSSAALVLQRMMEMRPNERGILPDGFDFKSSNVGNIYQGPIAAAYRKAALSRISACVGLSYSSVSGDLDQANYSSLQQGHLQDRALYRRTQALVKYSMSRVIKGWLRWNGLKSRRLEVLCDSCTPKFLFPPFESLDRIKDAQANKIMLEQKLVAPSTLIQGQGQDPDAVFRQIAKDYATIEKYKQEEMAKLGITIEDPNEEKPNNGPVDKKE